MNKKPASLTVLENTPDPWHRLRTYTDARIALGRTGGSLRTESLLDFRMAHARARDAVYAPFDAEAFAKELSASGIKTVMLSSKAPTREDYLANPSLGRSLSRQSHRILEETEILPQPDLAIIVSDGLSANAAQRHAAATIVPLARRLADAGWTLGPVFVVPLARVKIQDEIGVRIHAKITLMLLGERPGLDSPDSLGAYFTYAPSSGSTDADRNCVSNIRPEGLPPDAAAETLFRLLTLSRRLAIGGVALKDNNNLL